ncbi:MAG: MFS transporter, partial [Planctomycetota bacterium]|nr:MFS transporter [Planctomycetota bacterium]
TGFVNLLLTVPFVLLLGWSGQLADRLPKHRIITATRLAEMPIAGLALLGFWIDSPWVVLVAFALLASESAVFNPSKYGCIREISGDAKLNEANGIVNMTTNIAILLGIGVGGPLLIWSEHAVGIVIVALAIFGFGSSLMIRGLKSRQPDLGWRWNPFGPYIDSIRVLRPGLVWAAALAWAWFYVAAIVAMAVIPEYEGPVGLSKFESSGLLAALSVGIGAGCLLSGRLSGIAIRGRFSLWGGLAVGVVFLGMGLVQPHLMSFWILCVLLFAAGLGAGFFLIPLQAIQQLCSADGERARVLATANALAFLLMSLGSLVYWGLVAGLGISPFHMLALAGLLMIMITLWICRGGGRVILRASMPT